MPDYSDTRIQFRRGSYTQWANSNPVLASGEPGFDTTNNILKVGDGSTQWASLSGVGGNGGGGGGSTTFVGLLDTPANFTGAGGKIVAVNSAASALEYIAASDLSITESQISDLGSYLTSVGISDIDSNVIITETEGIASNDNDTTIPTSAAVKAYVDANAGGSEVNDLTSSVTWANVPDANITESSVVQHSGAIRITESQIVDLGHTSELNDLTANVTWANVPDTNITESSVVQHSGALRLTESQIVDLGDYVASGANVSLLTNDAGYLTAETNDLTSTVTWTNVPDANITESAVVQHSGALRLTESQIVDLQPYLTSESNDLTANVTWANVPDANITESSVVQHSGALLLTESQIVDLGNYVASGDNVSLLTNDANYLTSETLTSLGINANILKYTDENGAETDIDLSLYLDDTNLARLVSGTLDSQTAIATFTRDDSSTFTVDFSSLLSQAEINDLTASVTWANVPDTNITESSVVQHSGALRLTESQIVDLQSYLTSESNDLTTSVTWANVPDVNITESSVVQHSGALRLTESQISDLTHYTDGDVDIHLNTSTATNNQILSWTGTDYDWVDQTLVGTSTVVAPFAFVRLATTSNGSGTGMSWSNWDAVNGTMDFTFDNAQPDTNYIVVTDGEGNDDGRLVSIQNKTVNGFEASFYDTNGIRTPSAADAYALIVYGSTPTTTVVGSGSLTDLSVTTTAAGSAALSYDNANGTFTYTPPDLSGYLTSFTETNDLTSAVTWANVPDANITESSVVQHSGALRITESQITDLQSYLTSVSDDTAPSLGGELNLNNNDIVIDCRNSTGSQILAGTPVYVIGYYSANGKALIAPARSDDSTKMPAIGVLNSTIDDGNEGTVGVMGVVSQINTNSFEVGETLYVGPTGGLTNVKPSGDSELIQNLGRVLRKDASQGKIILLGAGRTNDVPNSGSFSILSIKDAFTFPTTDGSANQILKTNGAGVLSWANDATSAGSGSVNTVKSTGVQVGGSDIVTLDFSSDFSISESPDTEINIALANTYLQNVSEDSSPSLGANLDLNSYSVTGSGGININNDVIASGELKIGGYQPSDLEQPEYGERIFGQAPPPTPVSSYKLYDIVTDSTNHRVGINMHDGSVYSELAPEHTLDVNGTFSCHAIVAQETAGWVSDGGSWFALGKDLSVQLDPYVTNQQSTSFLPGLLIGEGAKNYALSSMVFATNYFTNKGDAQRVFHVIQYESTDASDRYLTTDKSGISDAGFSRSMFGVGLGTVLTFTLHIAANNDTDGTAAGWIIRGCIKNSTGTPQIVGSLITENFADASMSSASVSVVPDGTYDRMNIKINGISEKTIRWVCSLDGVLSSF